jgi:Domain of unknown function (DUF4386)
MTRSTNARLAGSVLLLYIVTGVVSMVLFGQATSAGVGTAGKLASLVQHVFLVRVTIVLTLLQAGYAVVLGVTMYALTRDQDRDLALMALCCRVAEGVVAVISPVRALALLSIATAMTAAASADTTEAQALGALLLKMGGWTGLVSATCFAVGSTLFSYLFLRAREHPGLPGLAGSVRFGPARRGPSLAARRIHRRLGDQLHLDTDARVRSAARPLAASQGGRHAADSAVARAFGAGVPTREGLIHDHRNDR